MIYFCAALFRCDDATSIILEDCGVTFNADCKWTRPRKSRSDLLDIIAHHWLQFPDLNEAFVFIKRAVLVFTFVRIVTWKTDFVIICKPDSIAKESTSAALVVSTAVNQLLLW